MVVKHQSRETTTAQSGTSAHCCEQLLDLIDYFCFPDKKHNYWGWITFHQSVHVMFNDLIYLLVIVRFLAWLCFISLQFWRQRCISTKLWRTCRKSPLDVFIIARKNVAQFFTTLTALIWPMYDRWRALHEEHKACVVKRFCCRQKSGLSQPQRHF